MSRPNDHCDMIADPTFALALTDYPCCTLLIVSFFTTDSEVDTAGAPRPPDHAHGHRPSARVPQRPQRAGALFVLSSASASASASSACITLICFSLDLRDLWACLCVCVCVCVCLYVCVCVRLCFFLPFILYILSLPHFSTYSRVIFFNFF